MTLEKESRFGNLGYLLRDDLGRGVVEVRSYDKETGEEISRVIARTVKPGSYDIMLPDGTWGRR